MENNNLENKLILLEEEISKLKNRNEYFKTYLYIAVILTLTVCFSAYTVGIIN